MSGVIPPSIVVIERREHPNVEAYYCADQNDPQNDRAQGKPLGQDRTSPPSLCVTREVLVPGLRRDKRKKTSTDNTGQESGRERERESEREREREREREDILCSVNGSKLHFIND